MQYVKEVVAFGPRPVGSANHKKLEDYILAHLKSDNVESDSFTAAVDALGQHVEVRMGDELEIGVFGFPPARYRCVGEAKNLPIWMPWGQKAA